MSPLQSHKSQSSTGSLSRANSTGAALRRGELKISEPIPIPREGIDGFGPQAGVGSPEFQSTTSLRNPRVRSGVRASANPAEAPPDPQLMLPSTKTQVWSDYSSPSHHPHDSMSSTPSKLSVRKKRKDSTLKSVMRKIFGSKRGEEQRKSGVLEHHRSTQSADIKQDLGRLGATPPKSRPPRSSSVPISEVTGASALGSHSPFPPRFDLNIEQPPEDASPEPRSHRRRATLPSIVFTQDELREIAATLGHGVSESGRNDSLPEGYDKGFRNASSNPRRRSRSAGKAQDVTREHQMSPIQWRRRSDEIKYWRNSLIEQPIPTIPNSRPPTTDIAEPTPAEESQPKYPTTQTPDYQETPFDFGPLIGSIQNTESATVEQRITTLEVKAIDLEYAISKLQGHDVAAFQSKALGEPPKRRGQTQNSAPASSQSSQRNQTVGRPPEPSTGTRGQMQVQPTFLTSPTRSIVVDDDQRRPTSDVNTLRPQTAAHRTSPPAERPHSDQTTDSAITITAEHYKTLITLIKVEEAARKKLEIQVMQLQRQLQELQSVAAPQVRARAYPTPSPEEHVPPALSRRRHAPSGSMASRRTEAEGEESDDGDGFVDVFETPSETHDHKPSIEYNKRQQMAGMI